MDGEIRRQPANHPADADVLDDGGVDSGGDDRAQVVLRPGEFVGEDEGVKGHVAAHTPAMEKRHQLRQIGGREIACAHARIEAIEPEVDRVGAVLDRGAGARPVAGGREQLQPGRGRRGCLYG